jgi:hypothetical protein
MSAGEKSLELPNRRSAEESQALLNSTEILDEDEQQAVLEELMMEAQRVSSAGRSYFTWLYVALAVVFFTVLGFSFLHPFEMSHQKVFHNMVPHVFFQVYYVSMSLCFIMGGYAIHNGMSAIAWWVKMVSCFICGSMTTGWTLIFFAYQVTEPSLYWLPIVPVVCLCLAVYTDRDYDSLLVEVARLADLKYDYKKA